MENSPPPPDPYAPPATFTLAGFKPPVVLGIVVVALALFVGINTEPVPLNWGSYARWGGPNVEAVWSGAYWGLVTSNFLHVAVWHIGFNLWWLWLLGRKIEYEEGSGFVLALVLTAAFVAGAAELAADKQGIGLSGVVYALFGYIWVRARTDARYQGFLQPQVVRWLLGWLLLCIILTKTNVWQVGNEAHAGGLVWGMAVAWLWPRRAVVRYAALALLLAVAAVPVAWAPWTVGWLSHRAYALHAAGQLPQAADYYRTILRRDPTGEFAHFAQENLRIIEVYELSKRAQQAYEQRNWLQAKALCQQIVRLDSTNTWAKTLLTFDTLQLP